MLPEKWCEDFWLVLMRLAKPLKKVGWTKPWEIASYKYVLTKMSGKPCWKRGSAS